MKLGLILSNDWELYGDGSGDYFEIQHKPLEDLLKTVENHGAKLTVMAEVGQQWAHQRISKRETWAREVVDSWESILKETVKRKSDVQLHLHPQWLNAKYENNKWNLDLSQWAISSLTPVMIEKILGEGKQYLDSLLQPVDSEYECIAFRAGAYCIQPSKVVIQNLLKAGIVCDTSVTKGMYNPQFFDYRDAQSNFLPWFVSPDNVKYKGDKEEGLLEIPIYSCEVKDSPIFRKFISQQFFYMICLGVRISKDDRKWLSDRNKKMLQRYPLRHRPFIGKRLSIKWLLSKLITKTSIQLDYDILPPRVFVKCIEKIYDNKSIKEWDDKEVIIPVMASGHVKGMHNCQNVDRILSEINISLKEEVIYWTLSDAVRYWIKDTKANSEETERNFI